MIYTVTLNPGLDYNLVANTMEYGKTNRCHDEYFVPGGKGLNVSVMLSNFDVPSTAFGFVSGFTGQELIRLMEEMNVPCDFVDVEDGFTRINVKVSHGKITEYNGAGISLKEEHIQALIDKVAELEEDDILVMSGSIPKGADSGIYARLMAATKAKVVLDTSGEALLKGLEYKPFLIKPNDEEIAAFADGPIECMDDMIATAKKLQEAGAVNVMVSLGADGAFLVASDGEVYSAKPPKVPGDLTLNTVAAGDSMLGGFLFACTETPDDFEEILKFSVAVGTAAAYSHWIPEAEFCYRLYDRM